MKFSHVIAVLSAIFLIGCSGNKRPPEAAVKTVIDNYYGIPIKDPYRYMENMDDTIFLSWMKQYADYSRAKLDAISGRSELITKFQEFDQRTSERFYGLKISESGDYFYLKIKPSDDKAKLFHRESFSSNEKMLFDPDNFLSESSASYIIASIQPNATGDLVGVALAPDGTESLTMIFIEVETGKILEDRIERIFGSFEWLKDGRSFIYGQTNTDDIHNPQRLLNTKVYYHSLGDSPNNDKVIFSGEMYPEIEMRPEEIPAIIYNPVEDDFYLSLSSVDRYLKLFYTDGTAYQPETRFQWQTMVQKKDEVQDFYVMGEDIYLYTAKGAPGFKIVKTLKRSPDVDHAAIVVPEHNDGMISGLAFTNEALYYKLKVNGVEERLFRVAGYSGSAEEVTLPAKAGSLGLSSRGYKYGDLWVTITGWTRNGTRFRYLPQNSEFKNEQLSSVASFPEYDDLVVEELMIPSHDGVLVPLSIIYKKGIAFDGTAPVLMTGYGAYGIPRKPYFNPFKLTWTLQGGIYVVSHVRGGGELGESWRLGGYKTTKPNTWKDFIASAEYLIEKKYTSPEKLAIYSGSAGGILIGRSITERPDLFAAAIPMVGLMNPIRAEQSPNGPVNAPEFGTVEDSVECMALIEMDPYLHIEEGIHYPAVLVTAGFNDPRVIVWQPAKFAARLAASNNSRNPVLFDVNYSSGHGVGDTKSKQFSDMADLLGFALWQTGHPDFQVP